MAWVLLALILLVAGVLRAWHLGQQSFWLDEFFSLECSFGHDYAHLRLPRNVAVWPVTAYTDVRFARPWWSVPRSLDHDLHPPLPYLMLRGWCGMFGYTEAAVRSLSVAASLAGIALLFAVARRLHGSTAALWACLLMALAQPQIEFAQEAKHYALLTAWCLAAVWAFLRVEADGATAGRCGLLFSIALAALFTHYYAIEALVVLGLCGLVRMRGRERWRVTLTLAAAVSVFAVIWGPVIVRQGRNIGHDADFLKDAAEGHLSRTIERAAVVPARLLSEPPPGWDRPAAAGAVILCLLPWLLPRRRPELLIWALWLPAVILPTVWIDLRSGTWALALLRYSLLAGPAVFCIVAAIGQHLRWPALRIALPLLTAISCAQSVPSAYRSRKPDMRTFGQYLGSHARRGDAIVFASVNDPAYAPSYYFIGTAHYAGVLPGPTFLLDRPADAALLQRLRRYPRVWVVSDTDAPQDTLFRGARYVEGKYSPLVGSIACLELPNE